MTRGLGLRDTWWAAAAAAAAAAGELGDMEVHGARHTLRCKEARPDCAYKTGLLACCVVNGEPP